MVVNRFSSQQKKKIQITVCNCIKSKLRDAGITFYSQEKLYKNVKDIYVVPCPRHPLFKERFRNVSVDILCNCLDCKF